MTSILRLRTITIRLDHPLLTAVGVAGLAGIDFCCLPLPPLLITGTWPNTSDAVLSAPISR